MKYSTESYLLQESEILRFSAKIPGMRTYRQRRQLKGFSDRLNEALDDLGIPRKGKGRQVQLGQMFNVSQKGARRWLEGETMPTTSRWSHMAAKLQVRSEWLFFGHGLKKPVGMNIQEGPRRPYLVPLISWVQAGHWMEIEERSNPDDYEYIDANKKVGPNAFCLRIVGHSMENPNGHPTFPHGSLIIVDPDIPPSSGRPIIARLASTQEAVFKMYHEDAGRKFLSSLHPGYPPIEINEDTVFCGVVVRAMFDP